MPSSDLDRDRMLNMFDRETSFALVAIEGARGDEMPALLERAGYRIRAKRHMRAWFNDVLGDIQSVRGPNNSIVDKAWYVAAGFTILLDPEMVIAAEPEELDYPGLVLAAIWERVSETVMLTEIRDGEPVRHTSYVQRAPNVQDEQINPHPAIVAEPSARGLREALSGYLDVEDVFGEIDATIVELLE